LKEAGLYADAVENFKKAIEKNALNARLYYEAGISQAQVALTKSNESEEERARVEALRFLEKSVALDQNDPDSLFALATMYSHFYDRYEEADRIMTQYDAIMPALPVEALFLHGFIAAGLAQNQRSANYYNQIVQLNTIDQAIKDQAASNRNQVLNRIQ
jgi:tetratricopeptide (TPR) repeat protein